MSKVIDIGNDFYPRLANRNKFQGDGKHTAEEFREKYLSFLDNEEIWSNDRTEIELDFKNVRKIGPSFANEAFAYFCKYSEPQKVIKKIKLCNLTDVKKAIILEEIESGYNR